VHALTKRRKNRTLFTAQPEPCPAKPELLIAEEPAASARPHAEGEAEASCSFYASSYSFSLSLSFFQLVSLLLQGD
jgi:hypothetical protein